jgi:hypothetical protein
MGCGTNMEREEAKGLALFKSHMIVIGVSGTENNCGYKAPLISVSVLGGVTSRRRHRKDKSIKFTTGRPQ